MARKLVVFFLFLGAFALIADDSFAQRDNSRPRSSPNASISQTIGTTIVDVHFSRPAMRGRTIFGDLVPWGEVWRAGANEPTTITVSGDVEVAGQTLEAGTYNLFLRPNQNAEWDVIFTSPVRWGTMYADATPVLEVTAPAEDVDVAEWLSYSFKNLSDNSADLVLHWADKRLPITISVGN